MIRLRFNELYCGLPYHAALVVVGPDQRGTVLPHTHDFYELVCVVAGRGVHRVGEVDQPLEADDLLLIRPTDTHWFAGTGPEALRLINIAFPSSVWRVFTDLTAVSSARGWDLVEVPPRVGLGSEGPEAVAEFQRALEAFHRRPRALDLARVLACILPFFDRDGHDDETFGGPAWLARACAAMSAEENLQAGLPRLLELAAVSHGYLDRTMRAHYGSTPIGYIGEQRLVHAALLLTTTTENVGRIASRCGFTSLSYFGRRFRERYGTSAREYRRAASGSIAPLAGTRPNRA